MSSSEHQRSKAKAHGPTVNAIKRAKYEAKQEHRRQSLVPHCAAQPPWKSWFIGREEYAAYVTVDDVRYIRQLLLGGPVAPGIDDEKNLRLRCITEWIAPFFDLKEKSNASTDDEQIFISEGTEAVRMMIQRCETVCSGSPAPSTRNDTISPPPIRLLSILSKPATFFDYPTKLMVDIEKRMGGSTIPNPSFKIVIANEDALSEIAGFPIARGAMACAVIPSYMQRNGYAWLTSLFADTGQQQPIIRRILALDAVSNAANMGSIIRTAAAFSIDAIILSDDSCDAWYRQSVRTSMGHVISVPIIRVADWGRGFSNAADRDDDAKRNGLASCLRWLRERMNVECFAAVVDDDDVIDNSKASSRTCFPPLVSLDSALDISCRSWCCVLGNEGHGIRDDVVRECDKRLKIRMASGVDSLSLPIAAGILMYGLSHYPRGKY
jgi:tRNA G18 (ribose-2'-O)-methylase SpoU